MILSEAKLVASIVSDVDCSVCMRDIMERLAVDFPKFAWSLPKHEVEVTRRPSLVR